MKTITLTSKEQVVLRTALGRYISECEEYCAIIGEECVLQPDMPMRRELFEKLDNATFVRFEVLEERYNPEVSDEQNL